MSAADSFRAIKAWRPTTWAAIGWIVYLVLIFIFAPFPACTVEHPCGPDWSTGTLIVGWGLTIVLLFWQPAPARWVATIVGVVVAVFSNPREDPQTLIYVGSSVLVPFTWWACSRVVGKRRELSSDTGLRQAWPGQSIPLPVPGGALLGVALSVVGAAIALYGYLHQRSEQQWQRDAERVDALVTKHLAEDAIRVRLPDGSTATFDTYDDAFYPVGQTQPVWTDGDKSRLVAEPYDGSGWGALGFAGIALGLAFLWRARDERRRVSSFFREPQPVTVVGASRVPGAVLLFEGPGPWTQPRWVLPTFDYEDTEPVDFSDSEPLPPPPPPTRATAFGVLAPGEPVGVDLDGSYVFGTGPLLEWETEDDDEWQTVLTEDPLPAPADTTNALPMGDTTIRPRVRRVTGPLLMLCSLVAAVWLLTDDGTSGGTLLYRLGICAIVYGSGYVGAAVAMDVTREGLRVRNALRETRLPWTGVERVSEVDGTVLVFTHEHEVLPLIAANPVVFGKEKRGERARALAGRLQARLEAERATEPSFVHPNDRQVSHVSRWEPAAAGLLFAVVAVIAARYR